MTAIYPKQGVITRKEIRNIFKVYYEWILIWETGKCGLDIASLKERNWNPKISFKNLNKREEGHQQGSEIGVSWAVPS
jgi:hypothetical protein